MSPSTDCINPVTIEHRAPRNYASPHYVLPSDNVERARLYLQHELLKHAYSGRLLFAPIEFNAGDLVLDSGTGSGLWLLDLAKEVPATVNCYGIDIEPRLFPASYPHNVCFSVTSVTALPSEWENTFVLAHQRLLLAGLRHADWIVALREMHRVLVPSGWIQLGEVGACKAGPISEKFMALVRSLFNSKGLLIDCSARIPGMLHDAGFSNLKVEERSIPLGASAGIHGADGRDNYIGVFRGFKTPILKAGGLGYVNSEIEYDTLVDEVKREWDETPGAEMAFFVFYAQK